MEALFHYAAFKGFDKRVNIAFTKEAMYITSATAQSAYASVSDDRNVTKKWYQLTRGDILTVDAPLPADFISEAEKKRERDRQKLKDERDKERKKKADEDEKVYRKEEKEEKEKAKKEGSKIKGVTDSQAIYDRRRSVQSIARTASATKLARSSSVASLKLDDDDEKDGSENDGPGLGSFFAGALSMVGIRNEEPEQRKPRYQEEVEEIELVPVEQKSFGKDMWMQLQQLREEELKSDPDCKLCIKCLLEAATTANPGKRTSFDLVLSFNGCAERMVGANDLLHSPSGIIANIKLDKTKKDALYFRQRLNKWAVCGYLDDPEHVVPLRRRLMILVNPFAGTKNGRKIAKKVANYFDMVPFIDYDLVETLGVGHAAKIAASLNIRLWHGIICISGSGTVHEVVNGLLNREDWNEARRIPVSVIPAGTGNGIAACLGIPPGGWKEAVVRIVHWRLREIDAIEMKIGKNNPIYSVQGVNIGFVADMEDFGSDKLRGMGEARFVAGAAWRTLFKKKRKAVVRLFPNQKKILQGKRNRPTMTEGNADHMVEFVEDKGWLWIAALNGPMLAFDFVGAPFGSLTDGMFDVVLWPASLGKKENASMLSEAELGVFVKHPNISYFKTSQMEIVSCEKRAIKIMIDGERIPIEPKESCKLLISPGLLTMIGCNVHDECFVCPFLKMEEADAEKERNKLEKADKKYGKGIELDVGVNSSSYKAKIRVKYDED